MPDNRKCPSSNSIKFTLDRRKKRNIENAWFIWMVIFACLHEDDSLTYIWYCLCLTDNQSSINVLYTWGLVHKAISNLLEAVTGNLVLYVLWLLCVYVVCGSVCCASRVHISVKVWMILYGRCSTEWLGYYLKVYLWEVYCVFERNRQNTLRTERERPRLLLTEWTSKWTAFLLLALRPTVLHHVSAFWPRG